MDSIATVGSPAPQDEAPAGDPIDDVVATLAEYSYAEYCQEPAWGQARLGEEHFNLLKEQLMGCWAQVKGLAHTMRALEELLLL